MLRWMENFLIDRDENSGRRSGVIVKESQKWNTPRLSIGTNHVYSLYKFYNSVNSCMGFFVGDAKLLKKVASEEDCSFTRGYEQDIGSEWSHSWEMKFNLKKCKVMNLERVRGEKKEIMC